MIKIHLSRFLGEHKWSQANLVRQTGIRASTINDWYWEIPSHLSVEHLDKICEALDCRISDILEYIPNRQKRTGSSLIIEVHGNQKVLKENGKERSAQGDF